MKTTVCMAFARSGVSCSGSASAWPDVQWVARLMKAMRLAGVRRGKKVRTTLGLGRKEAAAADRVNRQFVAERPDQLWVPVRTWQGFVHVAFIIDVFAGRIVGWRVSYQWKRRSCWILCSRCFGPDAQLAPSITQIKALNMCH